MTRVVIGLGSNLAQPAKQIQRALQTLDAHSAISGLEVSACVRSKAVGPGSQPDYCNAVAVFETALPAEACLDLLQGIEEAQGRRRNGPRWSARTLDLDILDFGQLVCNTPRLCLPHPRLRERNFVLQPWLAVQPDARLAPDGLPLCEALAALGQPALPLWAD